MRAPEIKARALQLVAAGINDCEISRRLGIPRATVRGDPPRPDLVRRLLLHHRHAKYEDLCFAFSNRSTGLLDLFAGLCDRLDLPYRRYEPRLEGARMRVGQVRINRREPAARILEHVGLKR